MGRLRVVPARLITRVLDADRRRDLCLILAYQDTPECVIVTSARSKEIRKQARSFGVSLVELQHLTSPII